MLLFLLPLLLGFTFHAASAFTATFSRLWGNRNAQAISAVLRDLLGIPLWLTGLVMAIRAPGARLVGYSSPLGILAGVFIVAGAGVVLWALSALRWQAAAPSVGDLLVKHGPYAHVRHPIHAGTMLELIGLALLFPTMVVLLAVVIGLAWLLAQSKLEEVDLRQRFPEYSKDMERHPRFIPRVR